MKSIKKTTITAAFTMLIVVMLLKLLSDTTTVSAQLSESTLQDKIGLGRIVFHYENFSEPRGQSCSTCHQQLNAHNDPGKISSPSADMNLVGNRNVPSISYIKFNPDLYWNEEEELWMGGFFLDGRARTLKEQAGGPLLNPLEMGNSSEQMVVNKLAASPFAELFEKTYGAELWQNTETAFAAITEVLAAYQQGPEFAFFDSKYDAYLEGKIELSPLEKQGLELFEAEDKGNCAACHLSVIGEQGELPLFTDYSYDNLGVPVNPQLGFLNLSKTHNPDGLAYRDRGLALNPYIDNPENETGKFKVPTLRNIELTPPYMHNGVFETLEEVVEFYNSRDIDDRWGDPEIEENVNTEELGDLGLTTEEELAIVAFMKTLNDGFTLP